MVNSLSTQRSVKVIVDADFLVNSESNTNRLFSLINSYRRLEVTVIEDCLKRACKSKTIEFNGFVGNFPTHGIKVISRHNLPQYQFDGLLANIDNIANYTKDFDSQLEITYAMSLGIFIILTDKKTDFIQVDLTTPLRVLSIDELEQLLIPPRLTAIKRLMRAIKSLMRGIKNNELAAFLCFAMVTFLFILVFNLETIFGFIITKPSPSPADSISENYYCPLESSGNNISCGEKVLYGDRQVVNQKSSAINAFNEVKKNDATPKTYQHIVEMFQKSWKEEKEKPDPETLIYLNNALLEAKPKNAYTIAILAPLSTEKNTGVDKYNDLGGEILRGVAHVQTLVNKCLLPNEFDFLPDSIKNNNILCEKIIKQNKGLRVLIVDDANLPDRAKILANKLNQLNDKFILAVIGHFASELTSQVIDTYKKNNLILISFGSTSESDAFRQKDFFFRTVPGVSDHVDKLIEYMKYKGYTNPAIFYNESSKFSQSIYIKFIERIKEANKILGADKQIKINKDLLFVGNNNNSKSFAGEYFNVPIDKLEKADVLILFPDGQTSKSMDNAVKIMKKNNGNKPILGTWTLRNDRFLKPAKDNPSLVIDKKLITYSPYDKSQKINKQYIDEATALWGDANSPITALSYDAAWVLVNAFLKTSNLNRETLKDTLKNMEKVENKVTDGATGDIIFDPNGNRNNLKGLLLKVEIDPTNKETGKETGLKFVPFK
ncbi:ABC transporter substrate-binding protein [Aphanothece sacrum]|uniref:Serine/threonine protein kinase n=1 Tax=Aphanothece sacrum FPU1 TaxID=1920663 RepID=A0A401II84_APHSA|nr:ABC transporter substrate-binding protein [Aphanothece sacrum]GBF80821.1 serine/threonine protein kinase [Aphanothece sacrum FPU1]GBF83316.1 serine/threonine protein kinase [Aphanothece sacrum FPU3]